LASADLIACILLVNERRRLIEITRKRGQVDPRHVDWIDADGQCLIRTEACAQPAHAAIEATEG
jgi:hypothetical protein